MVITQEELKKKFQGSSFIVGSKVIEYVCGGNYKIFVYYTNGNTFIESISLFPDFGKLLDNSFLKNFYYTELLSWHTPISEYDSIVHRLYELKGWK